MRLPHLTAEATSDRDRIGALSERPAALEAQNVEPQGCCGAKICGPLGVCTCLGVESPFC
jgi:hypothetical protein